MKNPKRDVPLALVAMLGAVTLLYMLVIWAYIAIDPGAAADASSGPHNELLAKAE